MRARLWWLVVLAGSALVIAAQGASAVSPPTIVSFGDSIAAGEGSGADRGFPDNPQAYSAVLAARLGGSSYNFAITGACASAGKGAAPGTDSAECKVSKSIITQQIPAARKLGPAAADVVTITVGTNDIHFSDCFRALVFTLGGPASAGEPDPCAPAQLASHLQALSTNLGAVLSTVKAMYPTARIAVTGYGNVIPQFVDSRPQSLCSAVSYLYAYELFRKGGVKALGLSLLSRNFNKQVGAFQESLYQYADTVLQQLNATIRAAASSAQATFVPLNLTGHDFCRDYASSTSGWVFAPQAKGSVSINWHGLGPHQELRLSTAHAVCAAAAEPRLQRHGAARRFRCEEGQTQGRPGLRSGHGEVRLLRRAQRLSASDAERSSGVSGQSALESRPLSDSVRSRQ